MEALSVPMADRVARLLAIGEQLPQVEAPQFDHFGPGVYVRELQVPAGTFAVGAVHRTEHLAIVIGHCWLTTDEGVREFWGVHVVKSKAGAQRAIAAITECRVFTIHPTDETDPEKLVELLTHSKASELAGGAENRQLLASGRAGVLQ